MTTAKMRREIPQMESINRISKIPVIETGMHMAKIMYGKIKKSNALFQWSLGTVEGGIQLAIDKSLVAVPIIEMPLTIVDTIVCKGLDSIEQRVPAISYPPEKLLNMTKVLVSTKIVQPVIKRADSVKQFSVQGASKYGEIAASHLDSALDVADQYVDKYLPDTTDIDSKVNSQSGESKTIQAIGHVNRLSKKLQRRLTKRTLAEARALRKQGADTVQVLLHLLDLALKDPKQFVEKMKTVWKNLSQDEPENQIPPANLEQLIAMLTRETARRFVHLTNYTITTASKMPTYTVQSIHILNNYASNLLDYINKAGNLERIKAVAIARAKSEVDSLYHFALQLHSHYPDLLERFLPRSKTVQAPSRPSNSKDQTQSTKSKESTDVDVHNQEKTTKDDNISKKEVTFTNTKKESKKKRNVKDATHSGGDENSNSSTIENGSAPIQSQ